MNDVETKPKMAITLTESAAKHVASRLVKRGKGVGLRLGVRTSGCSGLAYKIEYADDLRPEDLSATMFHLLGLDPKAEVRDALNKPLPISKGDVIKGVLD